MPIMIIEIANLSSQEKEVAMMEAARAALQETFNIANNDITVRLVAHEPHRFHVPPGKAISTYTHISIDCIVGRSLDTKRNLYRTLVQNLESLGIPKDHIKILLREVSKENWGIRGGQAACDVDLGYKVEV